jgi:hypothetical protein
MDVHPRTLATIREIRLAAIAFYWDLLEAALRGTAAAAVTASQSDFTSVSDDGRQHYLEVHVHRRQSGDQGVPDRQHRPVH